LFLCLRRLHALGGDLVLCSLPPRIEFILRISGFDQVFNVVDTQEAAECFFRDRVERD
jgi:anti-anti-sigma regulatory factor